MNKIQRDLLFAVARFWDENQYAPSFAELAEKIGRSRSQVHKHVHSLISQGYLREFPHNRARRLTPTHSAIEFYRMIGVNLDSLSQDG